jgi:hypothetical protein
MVKGTDTCGVSPRQQSVVAVDPFAALVPLLGFQAQGGHRPGVESGEADRLAGLFAIAVGAVLDPAKRFVDLGNELPLTVTGAEFESPVSLRRGPVGQVRMVLGFLLEVGDRFARFAKDLILPVQQLLFEVLELSLVHEGLVVRRTILDRFL